MQYKGRQFSHVRNVVSLPVYDPNGEKMPYVESPENYVIFGKVSKLGEKKAGAFKSCFVRVDKDGNKEPLFAVPIKLRGYSLTNMAYGEDGYVYLMFDGKFYRSKEKTTLTY